MAKEISEARKKTYYIGKATSEKVIMIKCRKCEKLNEEDSKFCQECGQPL